MIYKESFGKARRVIVWLFLFLGVSLNSQAQFLEYGGGIGILNYSGDLDRGYPIDNIRFGIRAFHRMSLSDIVAVKYAIGYGKVAGSDDNPIDPFAAIRRHSFERGVFEGTMTFEYNFLDYKDDHSPIRWSPYVFGGIGFARVFGERTKDYNKIQPMIPFGLGFKHLIGKQFALGLEIGLRKTFFDELDEVSEGDVAIRDFTYGNPEDDDWYSFTTFSISYILYKIPCPFRYIPNRSIYQY
ncbi:MAG: DUF6089 family protein [Cyclobacteriaceae bacterium]